MIHSHGHNNGNIRVLLYHDRSLDDNFTSAIVSGGLKLAKYMAFQIHIWLQNADP